MCKKENSLLVGYGNVDITPQEAVPLGGYGNSTARMSRNVLSPLRAICLACTDADGSTVLLVETDLIAVYGQSMDPIRQAVAQATGISADHILVACTHTHSAPDLECDHPTITRYLAYLQQQLILCAREALADRKPAALSLATAKTKDVAYVRHLMLEDGSYKGVNLNLFSEVPVMGHSTEADSNMTLLRFTREGGRDILLLNWQCHPHRTGYGKFDVSADIVGVIRQELDTAYDCDVIYLSGASGNINPLSMVPEENFYPDWQDHGKAIAAFAIAAKDSFVSICGGKVQAVSAAVNEPFNRPDPALLDAARDVAEHFKEVNDHKICLRYAETKGLHSQYHALSLLTKEQMQKEGCTHIPIHMTAFSIGDVGFIGAPYEMFDTNGKYVRDFSPFKATIVASLANDCVDYIPSAFGYLNDCYEADSTLVAPGAGERLAQRYVKMLEKLYETK